MYTFNSKIRYSELDSDGKLTIPSIINYFQDCTNFHSESIGAGLENVKKTHRVWLLARWQIVVENTGSLGDEISISTWAKSFDKTFGYRNFSIFAGDKLIAKATSKWFVMDTDTLRISRITKMDSDPYPCEDNGIDIEESDDRLKMPEEYNQFEAFPVRRYHLDTNGHVNNEKYVQMAMEYIPEGMHIREIIVDYKKQAVYGDTIRPCVSVDEENRVQVALLDTDKGKPYAFVRFSS